MSDFKDELRIGSKLSIVFTAEEFEDWHDRFVGLLKARNLFECLHDSDKTGIKEDQAMHILRENLEYTQFKAIFKQSSHLPSLECALQALGPVQRCREASSVRAALLADQALRKAYCLS
jgi:hypothetical protein